MADDKQVSATISEVGDNSEQKRGTVTIFLNKRNHLPPVYIISSMSAATLQEMSHTVDQTRDSGGFIFSHQFHNVPEGNHWYKFKLGPGTVDYAINDKTDTGLDDKGNTVNVIDVKYESFDGFTAQWDERSHDDTSFRIVDAPSASGNALESDVGNLEQAVAALQLERVDLRDVLAGKAVAVDSQIESKPLGSITIPEYCATFPPPFNTSTEKHVSVIDFALHVLSDQTEARDGLPASCAAAGSTDGPDYVASSSTTIYWSTEPAPEDDQGVSEEGAEIQAQSVNHAAETKEENFALARPTAVAGSKTFRRKAPWAGLPSMASGDSIQQVALWLAVGAAFGAFFTAAVHHAFTAPPDLEPL